MTRDEILNMPAEKINKLVCMQMETRPSGKTIAELRSQYVDWRYSFLFAKSADGWWKAEIGTDINLVSGIPDKRYDDFKAHWIPNKFPAYNIGAAWEVVEKLEQHSDEILFKITRLGTTMEKLQWMAEFRECRGRQKHHVSEAETAPLAICRAALLAVMK